MVKVSVIVPVYKVENYLVQCLDSIVKQTLEEIEIIIVDEGDQDRCREIIDFYEKSDPRIIAIHEHNGGYGASVNRGIERADGEYIGIVESDDFIEPNMFENLYECAKRTGANVVKTPFFCYYNPKKELIDGSRSFINQYTPKEIPFSILEFPHLLAIHPSLWSGLYKASEMQKKNIRCITAKGSGYADARFYVDILTNMDNIVWLDHPYYHWRITSENSSCNNWNFQEILKRWNENLDLLEKDKKKMNLLAPYFVTKSYSSIFAHYKKEKNFTDADYKGLVKYLNRYSEEQILDAPRIIQKQKDELLSCRNQADLFKKTLLLKSEPEQYGLEQKENKLKPIIRSLCEKKKIWLILYVASIYFLLLGAVIQTGSYSFILSENLKNILSVILLLASLLSVLLLSVLIFAFLYMKFKKIRGNLH